MLKCLEADIAKRRLKPEDVEHLKQFRNNLVVRFHRLDLASVRSVLEFGREISQTYVLHEMLHFLTT